ncbi:MAG: hypothetical protein ACLVJ6_06865 [Merdibacter sp.]
MRRSKYGRGFIRELIAERESGEYSKLFRFCERMYGKNQNKRAVESLIKSGALDCVCKSQPDVVRLRGNSGRY